MAKEDEFRVVFEVDDGYVTGRRPLYTTIDAWDIDEDMDDDALDEMYFEAVQEAFMQQVDAYGKNKDEFHKWAKEVIAKHLEEADLDDDEV